MKFQDATGPQTHDERLQSLAGMTPNARGAMVSDCALLEKADWLNTMLDCGLFDLDNLGTELGYAPAALSFIQKAGLKGMAPIDPEYGVLARPAFELKLDAKPSTVAFFERFVDHIILQKPEYVMANDPNGATEPGERDYDIAELFAKTMVAASALKRPDLMQRLADASPESAEISFDTTIIGSDIDTFMDKNQVRFTPYVFAMQFSDTEGMEILRKTGMPMQAVAATKRKLGSFDVAASLDIFEVANSRMAPICLPSAFGKALRDRMEAQDPPQVADLNRYIEKFLSCNDRTRSLGPCLIAVEKEGIFNFSPTHTARLACIHGHGHLIPNLVGIEWKVESGDVTTQPAWLALDRFEGSDRSNAATRDAELEKTSQSIATYWNRAIADGHPEVVRHVEVLRDQIGPDRSVEPVGRLIAIGANDALLAMMNAGLSPTQRLDTNLPTPLEMAVEAKNNAKNNRASDTENLLRSFSARGVANRLIDDMDLSPFLARL